MSVFLAKHPVSDVISICGTFLCVRLAFVIKLLQSDVFISLDQRINNYCYILHIFSQYRFLCDLAFKFLKLLKFMHLHRFGNVFDMCGI